MNKSGISLMSMVMYVVLFFAFMTFATAMATNMNYAALSQKGEIIVAENFQKLQQNILVSAKDSVSVDNISGNIVFSNNDEYTYNSSKKQVLKNGSKIISDVTDFKIIDLSEVTGISESFATQENGEYINIDDSKDYVCISVTIKKYGVEKTSQIIVTVGDENIE